MRTVYLLEKPMNDVYICLFYDEIDSIVAKCLVKQFWDFNVRIGYNDFH